MSEIDVDALERMRHEATLYTVGSQVWTTEYRGWHVDSHCEAVIHLSDRSRAQASWGWGALDRIIVYGTGTGENSVAFSQRTKARAVVEYIAALVNIAPDLLKALRRAEGNLKAMTEDRNAFRDLWEKEKQRADAALETLKHMRPSA